MADDKHHQIVALGRLGWSLRRIERTTGIRRETISGYLKAAGIVVAGRGRRASRAKPAIPTASVSTTLVAKIRPFPGWCPQTRVRRKRPPRRRCPPTRCRFNRRAVRRVRARVSRIERLIAEALGRGRKSRGACEVSCCAADANDMRRGQRD
jgi:hypothetical protein